MTINTEKPSSKLRGLFTRAYQAGIGLEIKRLAFLGLLSLLLPGCSGQEEIRFGYQPPLIPVQVSVNHRGQVAVTSSHVLNTPVGLFSISAGYSIATIRSNTKYPVLVVRVDDSIIVYELSPDNAFAVDFVGDEKLFNKVKLERFRDGDIVLELESVQPIAVIVTAAPTPKPHSTPVPTRGTSVTVQKPANAVYSDWCPGAFATRLAVGDRAKVVAVPRLVVREDPNTRSQPVHGHSLSNGRTVTILDGPVCNGGMLWWKAESGIITLTSGQQHNIVGWMAEESGDEWLLEPLR